MTPHRFARDPGRLRMAFCMGHLFPAAERAGEYDELDVLVRALGAEARTFHSAVPDPGGLPTAVRQRLDHGSFLVPGHRGIHENDLRHHRATRPEAYASVVSELATLSGSPVEEIEAMYPVGLAFSATRWIEAWGADYVHCSLDLGPLLTGLCVSALMRRPFGVTLDWIDGDGQVAALIPLVVRHAAVVVAREPWIRDRVRVRFGDDAAAKTVLAGELESGEPAPIARIRALLGRGGQPPLRTVREVFTTAPGAVTPAALPVLPFAILGAERTGSNMLAGLIDQHPACRTHGELFNPRQIQSDELTVREPERQRDPELLALRREDPGKFLERVLAPAAEHAAGSGLGGLLRGRPKQAAAGFKLLYYHGLVDDRIVDYLVARDDVRFVHLRRADRLKRHLSHVRADLSDVWFQNKNSRGDAGPRAVELDPGEAARDFLFIELMDERYTALFDDHATFDLLYEEMVRDIPAAAAAATEFLGVGPVHAEPRSRKTGGSSLASSIANYAALRAAFAGTRWQNLFPAAE